MSVIGRGVIEVSADATKLKAGIDDAKRSLKSLGIAAGDATKSQSASIDRYVKQLGVAAATTGKTGRELELYKLALRGASADQLKAADSALRMSEAYQKGVDIGNRVRTTILAVGAAAVAGGIAAAAAFDSLVKKAGDFQDMAEKIGDSAENIASLSVAAAVGGVSMESLVGAANKLTKGLTGVDDDSKAAGAAIEALGLNIADFKKLAPSDQIEAVAKALSGFKDGAGKSAAAMALFGKAGAEMLPFLKELAEGAGRQNILSAEQIALADEYADKQAKLGAQISLHAQAIATELLPAMNQFSGVIADLAKDQEFAATTSDILKAAMSGAIAVFQAATIVGSDVSFTFKMVGLEIGAIAAQLNALAHGDFAGFSAISDMVKQDAEKARAELDRFQAKILSISDPTKASGPEYIDSWRVRPGEKPSLKPPVTTKKDTSAGQEAKAQLALDLERIKSASEEITNTYSNAEKIMESIRSAGLLSEGEYYASKLAFLRLNSSAQEAELQAEIVRLEKETLTGADKLANDKKIAEAQGKLSKSRQDATANVTVLSNQETAAIKKVAQSYVDATTAAKDYLDTINRRNDREIAGMGRGAKARGEEAGRNQIEDRLIVEKQTLSRDLRNKDITPDQYAQYLAIAQSTYDQDAAAYDALIARKDAKNADWAIGASEAMQNYADESANMARQIEDTFSNAFKGMEDALVDMVMTGKADFKSLANSIIADIVRIQAKQLVSGLVGGTSGLSGLFGSAASTGYEATSDTMFSSAGSGIAGWLSGLVGKASGGSTNAGQTYLIGEKGPELLTMGGAGYITPNNALGSSSAGSGAITIVNNTSAKIGKVTEQRLSNGERALIISEAVAATAAQFGDPNSKTSRALSRNYSTQRSR